MAAAVRQLGQGRGRRWGRPHADLFGRVAVESNTSPKWLPPILPGHLSGAR